MTDQETKTQPNGTGPRTFDEFYAFMQALRGAPERRDPSLLLLEAHGRFKAGTETLEELNRLIVHGGTSVQVSDQDIEHIRQTHAHALKLTQHTDRILGRIQGLASYHGSPGGQDPEEERADH